MKKLKNKFNGEETVHFEAPDTAPNDTLCGDAIEGDGHSDSFLPYDEQNVGLSIAIPTREKVTCPNCIAIVKFCKKIRRTEFIDEESDT